MTTGCRKCVKCHHDLGLRSVPYGASITEVWYCLNPECAHVGLLTVAYLEPETLKLVVLE